LCAPPPHRRLLSVKGHLTRPSESNQPALAAFAKFVVERPHKFLSQLPEELKQQGQQKGEKNSQKKKKNVNERPTDNSKAVGRGAAADDDGSIGAAGAAGASASGACGYAATGRLVFASWRPGDFMSSADGVMLVAPPDDSSEAVLAAVAAAAAAAADVSPSTTNNNGNDNDNNNATMRTGGSGGGVPSDLIDVGPVLERAFGEKCLDALAAW
jgi:hypothetical protein